VLAHPRTLARTLGLECFELLKEAGEVDDDAVAEEACAAGVDEPGGEEVEREGAPVRDDRVSGVVPARAARADVGVGGENVDELALALVAPLRAEDDGDWRGTARQPGIARARGGRTGHGERGARRRSARRWSWEDRSGRARSGVGESDWDVEVEDQEPAAGNFRRPGPTRPGALSAVAATRRSHLSHNMRLLVPPVLARARKTLSVV
jgi:hypothetical protein